ncbi:DUF2177 family protein [Uliginosibacterium sp. H3]|uniref:DUF2177 family protein n=1 Tax=Uliginosibacterium silvisoli TaxID=3114758 RepID=A0ABU6K8R5_9RHOO|nr:DUF2177 family protein [Uliginosibacterium sp. H3]
MSSSRLTPKAFFVAYGVVLLVMAALDAVWLGWLGLDMYKQEIGPLLLDTPKWLPAALFYLCYPLGLVFLALHIRPSTLGEAVLRSAVVGLVAYGVYDLSNLATLRDWSVKVCIVDMVYGTCASGFAGFLAMKAANKFS